MNNWLSLLTYEEHQGTHFIIKTLQKIAALLPQIKRGRTHSRHVNGL